MLKIPISILSLALVAGVMAAPVPAPNPMSGKSVAELEKVLKSDAPEMDRANAALALTECVTPPEAPKGKKKGKKDDDPPAWELKIPGGFIDACIIGLADESSAVRFYSGQALTLAGAEALPALTKAVESDNDDCRISAIHAIGMMAKKMTRGGRGDSEGDLSAVFGLAMPALKKALKDENYIVREAACGTFSRLGMAGAPALDDLIALLEDDNFCVVNRAVHAVAAADPGGTRSVPALVATLESEHDVREFIVKELGAMGQAAKGAVPALCNLAGEDKNSWQVALESTKALLVIVTYEEKPVQDALAAERKQALGAIATAIPNQDAKFLQARIRNILFDHEGYCPIGAEIDPLLPWLEQTLRDWAKADPGAYPPPRDRLCVLLAKIGENYKKDQLVALANELKVANDTKESCLKDLEPILNLETK